jgi:deazaflavin-dependent oxidoreductase (nitroreductase family)
MDDEPHGGRAKTMAAQGAVNLLTRGLMRTPLLSRGVGKRLLTLYVVGRKSGRRYTIPVAYLRHEGTLLIGTPFGWARNLRTGDTVQIRLLGRRQEAGVRVHTGETEVVERYGVICRENHQFARLNGIGVAPDGTPNAADLREAWVNGARAIELTPH